ncbi:helix-turn-helix domain-containing protein [Chloroflexi bacterium TSY]|nr:helix-turn-helix domain-containing protein [Chloroflexi bacterium TSY]
MSIERAFGTVLRRIRNEKGISQEHLASNSDLHRTYISQLERGLKSPSLSALFQIAQALSVPPHQIILLVENELLASSAATSQEDLS